MRQKVKQLMGILLCLVMVLGLMPGMSLTAYADDTDLTGTLVIEMEFDIAPWEPFLPDDSPMDIPVIMTWNDNNNKDGNRPGSVVVRLLENGVEVGVAELNANNNWRYTFTGMPRLDEDKKKINYTITEDPVVWYNAQINGFNIRNNYEPELTSVTVKKIWDDANNNMLTRPESIVMTLSNGITVLLNDQNNWTATINDLPTRLNGEPANYTWTEQKVPGYDKVTQVTEGIVTTFTNYMNRRWVLPPTQTADDTVYEFGEYETPPGVELNESAAPTISITVGVKWAEDDDYPSLRPESVHLILLGDGEPAGEPKTAEAHSWETTWDNLPAQNTDGNPIDYTVKQMESLSAYTTEYTTENSGLTVINTLKTGNLNVKVSLSGAPEGAEPSGLELAIDGPDPLLNKTLTYADVESGTVNLGRVLEGAYLIRDTNADTLIEDYVMDPENSKVADAVYVSSGESSTLEFKYTWKLQEPIDEEVEEDYDPCADIGNLAFDIIGPDAWTRWPITYNEFTDGKYELQDLEPGIYTVVERNAETLVKYYTLRSNSITGLAVEVKPGEPTTAKLFNQYVPLPTPEPDAEFINIPVTATWNDNNNADGNRPESVTVRLYADGIEIDSHVLTAAEDWQYTFADKPRYQEDYKTEIVYTVNEDAFPMYAATVNGYNIVNDYKPEITSVSVSNIWNDNNNQQNLRPDSITMSLSDGQKVVKVVVLSAENGWTATIKDLPTVVNGHAAQYTWEEQQVPGYVLENVEQRGNHITFTNMIWKRPENNSTITPSNRTYDEIDSAKSSGGGAATLTNPVTVSDATSVTTHGKVTASSANAKYGQKVTLTLTSDGGWEASGIIVTDKNGVNVPVTRNADGTYSFIMPATAVTVTPTFEKAGETPISGDVSDRFVDVSRDAWYHDAVQWAVDKGLMNGVSDTLFAPNDTCTRAMVVTMLWRLAGEPAVSSESGFTDVSSDAWYAQAVAWAAETGAVNGTSETTFDPNTPVTREQLATILYRYAQAQGQGFTGSWMFLLDYPDRDQVSDWAYEPLCWMTMHGIITGMGDGTLAPKDNASRAQIATMFMRFCAEMAE